MKPNAAQIEFAVAEGEVLSLDADVVVLKYADMFYGVDRAVVERFAEAGVSDDALVVPKGKAAHRGQLSTLDRA